MDICTIINLKNKIMIKIILTFVIYLITNIAYSQEINTVKNDTYNITINVPKVVNNNGKIYFSLYNQKTFLTTALKEQSIEITNNTATITFKAISKGNYAVVCYHDSNNNNKLDFENGMPLEDFGSTNNVFNYGPPKFDDAKFEVKDKDLNFDIKF